MSISREELAAFADGEITGARAEEIAAAVEKDPALAEQVAAHRALKAQLGDHFAPILEQPVPDRLTDLLSGSGEDAEGSADVVDFVAAREERKAAPASSVANDNPRRKIGWIVGPALAASLAVAVFLPRGGDEPDYAGVQLAAALDTQLVSEQAADADTRILLSFRNEEGNYCRAYNSAGSGGIACRDTQGWALVQTVDGSGQQSTDFRQAGSAEELLAAAQEMAEGGAFDAEQEAAAKAKGWRDR